jgi:hypothetical protein
VTDLVFYNVPGDDSKRGVKKVLVLGRRVVRRLLRPIFQRQVEIYQDVYHKLDEQDRAIEQVHQAVRADMQAVMAFGWDYAAMVRRLAVLEDRVEELMRQNEQLRGAGADGSEPRARVA